VAIEKIKSGELKSALENIPVATTDKDIQTLIHAVIENTKDHKVAA